MNVLIPVRYPLTDVNKRAIQHGLGLVCGQHNPELMIFHLNELHSGVDIDRKTLRQAVEDEFGEIEASYVIRDGFLAEEAIIEAALHYEIDRIVLSERRRNQWRRLFQDFIGIDREPERVIQELTGIEVDVITDAEVEDTNDS